MNGRTQMSSIHRYMLNRKSFLSKLFKYRKKEVISRSHLPELLKTVDWLEVNSLTMKHYRVKIEQLNEEEWVAVDGKTLRGSLAVQPNGKKSKQGEVQLNTVKHSSGEIVTQDYYNGKKESEITPVRELLKKSGLSKKNLL